MTYPKPAPADVRSEGATRRETTGYFCFDLTGDKRVDAILQAVSDAAKCFHDVSDWHEPVSWLENKSHFQLISEAAAAPQPAPPPTGGQPEGTRMVMGDGDYSCATCGMGMKEPCEHWKSHLASRVDPVPQTSWVKVSEPKKSILAALPPSREQWDNFWRELDEIGVWIHNQICTIECDDLCVHLKAMLDASRDSDLRNIYSFLPAQPIAPDPSTAPPRCAKHSREMMLTFWDRPGGPPGNGWTCPDCVDELRSQLPSPAVLIPSSAVPAPASTSEKALSEPMDAMQKKEILMIADTIADPALVREDRQQYLIEYIEDVCISYRSTLQSEVAALEVSRDQLSKIRSILADGETASGEFNGNCELAIEQIRAALADPRSGENTK